MNPFTLTRRPNCPMCGQSTEEKTERDFDLRPKAWMRAIPPVSTPDGPGEWEVYFSYGDDEPVPVAGQAWVPLYRERED